MHSIDDLLGMVWTEALEKKTSETAEPEPDSDAQDRITHNLRLVEDEDGSLVWSE